MTAEIKAQGFNTVVVLIKERVSAEQLSALLSSLRPETRHLLDKPPLPMAWIDAEAYFDLIGALERTVWHDRPSAIVDLAEERMRRDLGSVYRLLIRLAPTQTVLAKVPTIWQTYTRGVGDLSVQVQGPRAALATYANVTLANAGWWHFQRGLVAGTLKSTGAKSVETRISSGGGNAPAGTIEISWR